MDGKVEQMRYSDEQICQPFRIPPFIVEMGDACQMLGGELFDELSGDKSQ